MAEHVYSATPKGRGLGAKPSPEDRRDHVAAAPPPGVQLPPRVDHGPELPEIYHQGQLGSCTANAEGMQYRHELKRLGLADFAPSRLFLYYEERRREGSLDQDAGAYPRDGYKVMNQEGLPPETDWPYDVAKFAQPPADVCYQDDGAHKIASYASLPRTLAAMKGMLAGGRTFSMGILVYASFESASADRTGVIPMPRPAEAELGGHDILVVGYDDATGRLKFANSWGTGWGDHGFGYLPYRYALSSALSFDRWHGEVQAP